MTGTYFAKVFSAVSRLGTVVYLFHPLPRGILQSSLRKRMEIEEFYFSEDNLMLGLGIQELLVILLIVFLIFGMRKLPEIGEGLGKGIKNFKSSLKEINSNQND